MVDPAVLVAGIAALAALALAVTGGFTHWTVPAFGPWAVAGAAVHVATRAGAYDAVPGPYRAETVLALVAGIAGVAWVLAGRLSARRGVRHREGYLTAAGGGVALALLVTSLADLGVTAWQLVWVVAVPLLATLTATVGFLAIGFLLADLFTDLRAAGLYTVVTVVFEGVASVAASELLGGDGGGLVVAAVRSGYAMADVDPTWWVVVAGQLAVGVVLVLVCGRLGRWRRSAGLAAVLVVSVVTLWSGTVVLLSAAALG